MAKACSKHKNHKTLSAMDSEYQQVLNDFIWSLNPQYMITLNFNFPNVVKRQDRMKYRNARPRHDWMKNFDAVINSRLVQRRVNRLLPHLRVSWVPFAEFTTTENLHYHVLLSLPVRHRFDGVTRLQTASQG